MTITEEVGLDALALAIIRVLPAARKGKTP
jgi:hypothetical protein